MAPLSEAQLAKRLTGIGSSEVGAVCGESPYASPHDVWLRKRGLVESDPEDGRTWLGHVIEPALAGWYAEETGRRVRRFGRTVRDAKHTFALASPDYAVHSDDSRHLLEIKSVGWRVEHHWDRHAKDGVPLYVLCQCTWQMGICGATKCDVAVIFLSDGERLIYELEFDPDLFAKMLIIVERFWGLVQSGTAPSVDDSDACRKVLESVYAWKRAELKPAPPEAEEWLQRRLAADAALKAAETEKALATNKLCEFVGDADGIFGECARFTWKTTKAGQRVARIYPNKSSKGLVAA